MIVYSQITIFLLLILLVSIIINSVFGFTNKIQENYNDLLETAAKGYNQSSDDEVVEIKVKEDKPIQAVVSKYSGKTINIVPIGQPPTTKCIIRFYGNNALTMNDDGTYSVGLSDKENIRQQWLITQINSVDKFRAVIPKNNINMGYSLEKSDYPFFLLISAYDNSRCLQYDNGSILVRPIGNYDSQKWDISYQKVENALATHKKNPISQLSGDFRLDADQMSSNEYDDKFDKIKLNLNLSSDTLQSLIGSKGVKMRQDKDNDVIDLDNDTCEDCDNDKWIPRSSVKSICTGCDPDAIDPI